MNKAAQKLGRLAAGVPKNYSAEEIARRSKILAGVNARRRVKPHNIMKIMAEVATRRPLIANITTSQMMSECEKIARASRTLSDARRKVEEWWK